MHDVLEASCAACGFAMRGLADDARVPTCGMCGLRLVPRTNLSVSRRLPVGMGLLMGAFAASLDASPLSSQPEPTVSGFARRWP